VTETLVCVISFAYLISHQDFKLKASMAVMDLGILLKL